jgi:HAD superfamily hydrolase (TIGR01549 family)
MKYFIFDFDGVLADSWDLTVRWNQDRANLSRVDTEQRLHEYFLKPKHPKQTPYTEQEKAEQQELLYSIPNHYGSNVFPLFQGFIDELNELKDTKMAVVSSGPSSAVVATLATTTLQFTHILCFDDHHSKEEKIARICKDWSVDPSEIYYFTDTLADYHELKNYLNPTKIIGCSWGFHGYRTLAMEIPTRQILRQFNDIQNIIS